MANKIDLHTHTTASDGTLTPTELVAHARELGLSTVAITDHDTMNGVAEAQTAGERLGVEVIPGMEISADYRGEDTHVLGYGMGINAPALREVLDWVIEDRRRRNERIADRMRRDGIDVSLEELEANRFSLLEEVKTVNIGNEMKVTLSIGIGVNGSTYAQNYEFSRIAIELALGRGGDQAVVKDNDKISYYGGKSQQMEKSTRVKARVKAHALREFIGSHEDVVIMGHKITDIDSFGAAVGVWRAARILDKKAHIVLGDINGSIRQWVNLFLNDKEYPEDMFVTHEQARKIVDHDTVVVVVDTNRPSMTECSEILNQTRTIVVLDHHRQSSEVIKNAVLSYIEPYASSACEMIAEILQYFADDIRLKGKEADCIYAGIIIDTNNFMAKTGVRTFEAAAFLRRCGADVTRVRKMFRNDMSSYKARAEAVRHAEVFEQYYAISCCPSEDLESPTVVGAQAANELLNIVGIKASFVLTEYKERIYISARAIDEVNVQIIMERLGGGGHLNIAGAQLDGVTLEEAKDKLKSTIRTMIEEGAI